MPLARADLESLLRTRQLDRTLTTALPPVDPHDDYVIGPTGVARLDEALEGGFPRGQLSEIVGARSSGRASLLMRLLAAATARGELVALVDALDMLDVESAAAAGIDLSRLLWIRGHVASQPGFCRESNQRAMEQAVRALALVLGAGHFGLVAFDVGEASAAALRRLPFTTWLRLQRMIEGGQTICVLIGSEPMARSSAGLTVRLGQGGSARGHAEPVGEASAKNAPGVPPSPKATTSLAVARANDTSGGGGPQRQWKEEGENAGGPAAMPRGEPRHQHPIRFEGRLFDGLDIHARVVRARARAHENVCVSLSTTGA